ncbi:MAG: YbbR-like domain-containing protein [Bacteroides sp.]|nr:YbbR-like domain-containing protein [Bacteroides sp.]
MQLPRQIRTGKRRATLGLTSLLRERGRDMLLFAFFFVVSLGFWLLQKLNDTFETSIRVPLELVGVPDGTFITSPLPSEVVVTVRDRGTNLFRYMQRSKALTPIRLDFSVYDNGSAASKIAVPLTDIQRAFQQQMLSSTQVQQLRPSKFEFHYNRGVCRRLPVKYTGSVYTVQQNYLQNISISPDSVMVYAPSAMLDTMQYAYTVRHDVTDLKKTTTYNIPISSPAGVKTVPESIQMTAQVDYYTEQTVSVPVVGLNFPADIRLRTFPTKVTVKYRVGASNAKKIKPDSFVLVATYEELYNNDKQKFALQLKSVPPGVSNVRIYPREIDYLLEYTAPAETNEDIREQAPQPNKAARRK